MQASEFRVTTGNPNSPCLAKHDHKSTSHVFGHGGGVIRKSDWSDDTLIFITFSNLKKKKSSDKEKRKSRLIKRRTGEGGK